MMRRRLAGAAGVIMLGTLTSSLLGFVRAFVIARYFGAHTSTDAFFAALVVPQMFYDQLIGGAIAAVLIPTFTRLSVEDEREMWRIVLSVFLLVAAVLIGAVFVLEIAARPVMTVIASGFAPKAHGAVLTLAVRLLRILLPALVFMGLAAVALATLYSLNRRAVSSLAPAFYHAGIIIAALLAATRWGIEALAVGAVVGALLQLVVQLPTLAGLMRKHTRFSLSGLVRGVNLRDPVMKRLIWLYLPVSGGMCVSIAGQIADINFKSHLPQVGGLTSMQFATQIIQFPVGVVVTALGFAVLPTISADAAAGRIQQFKETLATGLRLILLLMIPAMAGLLVLSTPIVALLFQRGQFTHLATVHTATALVGYAPQLPFIGLDQLLIVAFYARHNTLTPALAGMAGVAVYVALAFLFLGPLTILGLALANTIQIASHAVILLILLLRSIGTFGGRQLAVTLTKVGLATVGMSAAMLALEAALPGGSTPANRVLNVVGPVGTALAVYGLLLLLLRVEEATILFGSLRRRLVHS